MIKIHKLIAPRIGEGSHQVKIQKILKAVGEMVQEDENLLEVETDKALLEISSPVTGFVREIFYQPGQVADVGAVLLHIEHEEGPQENDAFGQTRRKHINRGISNTERPVNSLPQQQMALIRQMKLSKEQVITAHIETMMEWEWIDKIKKNWPHHEIGPRPSSLEIILAGVARSMAEFPKFRARLDDNFSLKISDESLIGIAISGQEDVLATPIISVTDKTDFFDFQARLRSAVKGGMGIAQYHSLSVSDMSALNVIRGLPIVVSPAIATLFIGTPFFALNKKGAPEKFSNLVLAFDHRIINGEYAARFLKKACGYIKAHAQQKLNNQVNQELSNV